VCTNGVPADRVEVVDRRDEAGQELVRERAGLEPVAERDVRCGPDLVRAPALEQLGPSERNPEMGAEELVRRADQDVDAPVGHVDRAVRAVVHGVRPRQRARLVGELDDPVDVGQRPDRVRGDRERDDPGAIAELALEVLEIEGGVVMDLHEPDVEPSVVRKLEPG
jgi:hypothetical protein